MADHATVYVRTSDIKDAVRGREEEVLGALGIRVTEGSQHIDCPYPEHGGRDDWRWDQKKAKAFCTCTKADSIFDVVRKCEDLSDFEETKIRVAGLIGREDLIRQKANQFNQASDAASLLSPPAENRDDGLVAAYLAHRLECERGQVPMPATPVAGIKAMGYFDPPPKRGGRLSKVGEFPCAVFGTVDRDGRRHAFRIYLAPGGAGKAGLGKTAAGHNRDPKKSAKVAEGDNTAGRSVIWGNPEAAEWVILAEGIETAAAVALAFRPEIEAGTCAVAAAINAGGVEAFLPWPSTKRITVAADRDEKAKPGRPAPTRRGEEAARKFGLLHHDKGINIAIALPGEPGDATDWLDVHLASGPEAVRAGILAGKPFVPTTGELKGEASRRQLVAELEQISREYPLPTMENMRLEYCHTKTGKVWVHRISATKDGPEFKPVATPFGISARLRFLDRADAYGVRIVVQDKPLLRSHASPDKPAPAAGEPTTRERLAEQLLEVVGADFAQHGPQAVARLRETNPSAYARLVGECVQFRLLSAERAPRKNPGKPRREPRQVRVNNLLKAAYDGPIDVNNPRLPGRWVNRWVEEQLALKEQGLSAFDLTPEELRARWPKRLAAWFEKQVRRKVQVKSSMDKMARKG